MVVAYSRMRYIHAISSSISTFDSLNLYNCKPAVADCNFCKTHYLYKTDQKQLAKEISACSYKSVLLFKREVYE